MEDPREKRRGWTLHFCSWNGTVLSNIHMRVPFPGELYQSWKARDREEHDSVKYSYISIT